MLINRIIIDEKVVKEKLEKIMEKSDLSRYILWDDERM